MPKKYHIPLKETPPRLYPVGKYTTVEFRENCAGSCRECVKKKCVYGIFKDNFLHVSAMEEPEYLYTCQSCFRCVQECTRGIFSRVINPEYRTLGDAYWKADIIHRTWYQAHTGNVPVSGAGYRGPFVAEGFDSMWTDMSEIVRPTRDGIHGREYINTCIELTRRPARLRFREDMSLAHDPLEILEVPTPTLFRIPALGPRDGKVMTAAAEAARVMGTILLIDPDSYTEGLAGFADNLAPCLTKENYRDFTGMIQKSRMVELADAEGVENAFADLRAMKPGLVVCVGVPLDAAAADRAEELSRAHVDAIHFYADDHGKEQNSDNPRFLKEMIREIHLKLVDASLRQSVNLLFSGGIAMAEHVAKAIICGADGVVVDNPLLIALECRLCRRCENGWDCPAKLDEIEPEWGSRRILNLMGAWRNQLLEVMGAMGIREARRLRGEVGRSMWFEDLEKESFGPIFGERKVSGLG
ncbi:MAG: hypothetical protein GY859_21120 [Desulfobacterales bacterium]|nr:hypothetical protein [Desulfobacterales bacterium]